MEAIQCHSLARLEDPPNRAASVELVFRRARMSVHRSGEPPGPGLRVQEFEVRPER